MFCYKLLEISESALICEQVSKLLTEAISNAKTRVTVHKSHAPLPRAGPRCSHLYQPSVTATALRPPVHPPPIPLVG